jgi:hypothetical protein
MIDWQKMIVRRTLEGCSDYPAVQLQFLLQRLEAFPDSVGAIAYAIRDMAAWQLAQADALEAEGLRRKGGAEIVEFPK